MQELEHAPNLNTVIMVEEILKNMNESVITIPELKKKIGDMLTQLNDTEYHPDGMKKEQLYKLLRREVWFEQRFMSKDEIVERCLSAFILGHCNVMTLGR